MLGLYGYLMNVEDFDFIIEERLWLQFEVPGNVRVASVRSACSEVACP